MYTIESTIEQVNGIREYQRDAVIGLTNGCFDVIHSGHVLMLKEAANYCSHLFVGVNTDDSVRLAKGWPKPWVRAIHRIEVVRAMRSVNGAFFFEGKTFAESISKIQPNIWFKGGDYTMETLDKDEVEAAGQCGCDIMIIPQAVKISSSDICARILALGNHCDANL